MSCWISLQMFEQILKLGGHGLDVRYGYSSAHVFPHAKLDTTNQETSEPVNSTKTVISPLLFTRQNHCWTYMSNKGKQLV